MANEKKMFAVFAVADPVKVETKITAAFADMHLSVGAGQWLLIGDATLTTTDVSNKLGITGSDEITTAAMVVSIGNYFGRAPSTVWEWITAKMGGSYGIAG